MVGVNGKENSGGARRLDLYNTAHLDGMAFRRSTVGHITIVQHLASKLGWASGWVPQGRVLLLVSWDRKVNPSGIFGFSLQSIIA